MPPKRRLSSSEEWHYEDDHVDDRDDVEEWEAQADGTFNKWPKSGSSANIDQLVQLQLDRGELMDEDGDEDEDEDEVPEVPDDALVEEEEEKVEAEGEGEARHVEEKHEGAEAKGERPCKRPKVCICHRPCPGLLLSLPRPRPRAWPQPWPRP